MLTGILLICLLLRTAVKFCMQVEVWGWAHRHLVMVHASSNSPYACMRHVQACLHLTPRLLGPPPPPSLSLVSMTSTTRGTLLVSKKTCNHMEALNRAALQLIVHTGSRPVPGLMRYRRSKTCWVL